MDEAPKITTPAESEVTFWDQHRYLLMVTITIIASICLVVVSMTIYNLSGAAQLDLSRPGYQSVSDKVDDTSDIDDYSALGPVNKTTVEEFTKLYDIHATKAKAVDAFNGDPLNPEVLEFAASSNE